MRGGGVGMGFPQMGRRISHQQPQGPRSAPQPSDQLFRGMISTSQLKPWRQVSQQQFVGPMHQVCRWWAMFLIRSTVQRLGCTLPCVGLTVSRSTAQRLGCTPLCMGWMVSRPTAPCLGCMPLCMGWTVSRSTAQCLGCTLICMGSIVSRQTSQSQEYMASTVATYPWRRCGAFPQTQLRPARPVQDPIGQPWEFVAYLGLWHCAQA
mmetsp:Transcript_101782/g.196926  ORF Transcript_101782/g.196926 Transcript_101782/m.196926 type:complete len:207 (-) Transcript_101782:626-1246(-)